MCWYFRNRAGTNEATLRGLVNENFVYIDLLKRVRTFKMEGTPPMFGTYKEGEMDFVVNNRENYMTYGVEVKAGKSVGRTAQVLLEDGKVEAVYFLKGDTYGGINGNMLTAPIYLAGRVKYDFKIEV